MQKYAALHCNSETSERAKLKDLRDEERRMGPMGILEPKEAETT